MRPFKNKSWPVRPVQNHWDSYQQYLLFHIKVHDVKTTKPKFFLRIDNKDSWYTWNI